VKTWWDDNALANLDQFKGWIGDHTAPSKVAARKHVAAKGYKSILDVGCGLCSEYDGYKADEYPIMYHGIDSCLDLVRLARLRGIIAFRGDVKHLPYAANSFDVVYIRHVLEHLPAIGEALVEATRVARYEVLIVWFIPPTSGPTVTNLDPVTGLYHNQHNDMGLEALPIENTTEAITHLYPDKRR
jgi:ubiquinone/menaquinone biosynthesis C-methylase UbiE